MSSNEKSLSKYWFYFGISMVALVAFLILRPEWCWVTFPFVFTYFVQANDWM